MPDHDLNRRDFHKLTMAALGGVISGGVAGCGGNEPPPPAAPAQPPGHAAPEKSEPGGTPAVAASDVHVCRGLNACKGKGADGKNACAGQGTCASSDTHHACSGANACKGQGGCGADPAQNSCKGKGGCHVPLMKDAWIAARKHFEGEMQRQSKEFGEAPAEQKE